MRTNRTLTALAVAACLTLVGSAAALAQLDDDFLEPVRLPAIKTGVVLNSNSADSINERVEATVQAAHKRVGGRVSDDRRNRYFLEEPLPDRVSVVRAARDMARSRGVNIVFIEGGDSQSTIGFADSYPNTIFVDLSQGAPCIDAEGKPDRSGDCVGGTDSLPFNYLAVPFQVQEPAYLAGVIAASASSSNRLGIISGMVDCEECNRYMQGFINGARSVEPDIDIRIAYLADDDEGQAFSDEVSARTFAEAFIQVYDPDVVLPVANDASVGVARAACDAGVKVIGAGIDLSAEYEELAQCVLTSITKEVEPVIRATVFDYTSGLAVTGVRPQTMEDGGVTLTPEWERETTLPVDTPGRYEDALNDLQTGAIDPCPSACGGPIRLPSIGGLEIEDDEEADAG